MANTPSDYSRAWVQVRDAGAIEPLGTKEKWWFNNYQKLFKANYKERGEDWAEVVVARFCQILGLPHAKYQLATASIKLEDELWRLQRGVITDSFYTRQNDTLIDGDQLLVEQDAAYPSGERFKVSQYTIPAVANVISSLDLPPDEFCGEMPYEVCSSIGVFAGYLMLDALVANQDRHHQNWGAIDTDDGRRLTPTFDHGASLAPAESDDVRRRRLDSNDVGYSVRTFASRSRSPFWDEAGISRLSLVEAWSTFALLSKGEAGAWLVRLERLDAAVVSGS
jgi:hypothetical protein